MKKLLCLALVLAFALALCACGGGEQIAESSEEPIESSAPSIPEKITVNGKDISEFIIVYRDTSMNQKYLYAARELRDFIKENWGVTLDTVCETERVKEQEAEIYVGLINGRELCEEYFYRQYATGEYVTVVSGSKIMFACGTANGAHFGIKEFCDMLITGDGEIKDGKYTGQKSPLIVACVGDSITQGINSTDPQNYTYPAFIQEMLGLDYSVYNLGLSGYSICRTDTYSYIGHSTYQRSLDLNPDIILFALGTNDGNPGQAEKNWEGTNREQVFVDTTKEMLDAYLALESKPQIYIILPASLFKVGDDHWNAIPWAANIENHSLPLLKQIALEYNLPTVDMWTWSLSHSEVFTDGLHPKDLTYKDFAQEIYEGIKDTVRKPE